ncbi:hypothetical protein MINS_16330 [Mycolicibacterium insubricum]|uniref:hypothetical protein n=1 Tax=Mycolicibacterium insubricum TaxID=444597 RepID=UPI001054A108|nr:hypothetical protein [Mycolicibacterium insubricum]MCB9440360.1 hypothetical protein [Mycolicibacterium sp.]MCV7080258.1 hypothetical protein [Mycolicibacterium insubricum]BBZ66204.1 hypothetical protein MINS_16330 [Mycolicibacterium insubricum]
MSSVKAANKLAVAIVAAAVALGTNACGGGHQQSNGSENPASESNAAAPDYNSVEPSAGVSFDQVMEVYVDDMRHANGIGEITTAFWKYRCFSRLNDYWGKTPAEEAHLMRDYQAQHPELEDVFKRGGADALSSLTEEQSQKLMEWTPDLSDPNFSNCDSYQRMKANPLGF